MKIIILGILFSLPFTLPVMAQENNQMVRLAKIKVDRLKLARYYTALDDQVKIAIRLEPGVLTYYAVAE